MEYKKPYIFISYASEDHAIASVFESALTELSKKLDQGLEVFLDKHSLERGRSLTDQILTAIEKTDVLLILYTEQLKKSHSFTGAEVGAFKMSIKHNAQNSKSRRALTVYLDHPPALEQDTVGIKLETSALSEKDPEKQALALDPGQNLVKLLKDISDLALSRAFALVAPEEEGPKRDKQLEDQADTRKAKRSEVDPIGRALVKGLATALSSIVSKSSIEQKLIVITWPPSNTVQGSAILSNALLYAQDKSVFNLFFPDYTESVIKYEDFKAKLLEEHYAHGVFTLNAIEEAVRTALRAGPVDNEQFFLSQDDDLFRIIVTRHLTHYDGSRIMNVYLVPALRRDEASTELAVASLLRVAVTFKSLFLGGDSEISLASFKRVAHNFEKVKERLERFMRQFLLVEHETHVNEFDNEDRYEEVHGSKIPPEEVCALFETWKLNREKLIGVASKVREAALDSPEADALTEEWISQLDEFTKYVEPLNKSTGAMAANRIKIWFETGTMP
ncbi:hypothetical protein ABIF68_002514 [Bradyrhizobium japonicum]